jgi:hypothetical protein
MSADGPYRMSKRFGRGTHVNPNLSSCLLLRGVGIAPRPDNWWKLYPVILESVKGRDPRQEFMHDIIRAAKKPNPTHTHLANLMRRRGPQR